jgi:peroxiredoxin Q/BCP
MSVAKIPARADFRVLAAERLVWHSARDALSRGHPPRYDPPPVQLQGIAMNRIRSIRYLVLAAALTWFSATWAADSPALGSAAPEFKLQDQNGKWHELKDYRGKFVALYFYPKDQTPGCTTQACEFRDNIFAFRDAGAVILGVSVDDVESHKKFSEKHGLPFPILADDKKVAAKQYGVLKRFLGTIELAKRDTFLIDPKGKIVRHYPDVDPEGHSQLVLKDIKELQAKS